MIAPRDHKLFRGKKESLFPAGAETNTRDA